MLLSKVLCLARVKAAAAAAAAGWGVGVRQQLTQASHKLGYDLDRQAGLRTIYAAENQNALHKMVLLLLMLIGTTL